MKRWYRSKEPDGYVSAYTSRVTLECQACQPPTNCSLTALFRFRYRTSSLSLMIQHYRNHHTANFVSLEMLSDFTHALERNDNKKQEYPFYLAYLVNYSGINGYYV